jgi:hypothetical protein
MASMIGPMQVAEMFAEMFKGRKEQSPQKICLHPTVGYIVEWSQQPTIQVVPDTKLLQATDAAAKGDRSALIRQALQQHLSRLRLMDIEGARPAWLSSSGAAHRSPPHIARGHLRNGVLNQARMQDVRSALARLAGYRQNHDASLTML